MKTQKHKQKGFWQKNRFWNTDMYTDKAKKELNEWADSMYKENIKADYIKK